MEHQKHILILSSCKDDWGGSEELWARSIPFLLKMGYLVSVCKEKINREHPQFVKLKSLGCDLIDLNPKSVTPSKTIIDNNLSQLIRKTHCRLVLISQGINFDGLDYGYICLKENIPYALIAQKAVDSFWPYTIDRVAMRNVYINASKAYFVSRHNLQLTEEQFGIRFNNSELVSNPIKLSRQLLPYPSTENGYRLACIGRFFIIDKGQDILIRILAKDKWKARPLKVSFIGSGEDKQGLIDLAKLLKVENIEFLSPQENIEELWKNYHALILPSRFEGTPLVLLEAMAIGRMAIASNAGGNSELITDEENGFIAQANEQDLDTVMEKAWAARESWKDLGIKANEKIKETVPELPERDLAESLDQLIRQESQLVTVIIPTYNRVNIIEDAIQSVLHQTHTSIQLIVVDDGSEDETDDLMYKYPEITYLKIKHGGQAKARNEGLRHARGKYIATLDSDDTWETNFIEKSIQIIEDNQLDFVFSNWMQEIDTHEFVDRFSICKVLEKTLKDNDQNTIILNNKELREMYLSGCPSPSSSVLFKRSSLNTNWTSGLKIADDWCLLMDIIFKKPAKAGFTRDILWKKKIDGQNLYDGHDLYEVLRDLWIHDLELISNRFNNFFSNEEKKKMRMNLSENYLTFAYFLFKQEKQYLSGIKYFMLALLSNNKIIVYAFLMAKVKLGKVIKRLKK